jgi:hypothetical protein
MFRLFKSWRPWRWVAFGISLAADAYAFYLAKPFTPESFQAAGLIALLFFLVFVEIGRMMRGRGRIRAATDDEDKIVYQVGQHLVVLLRNIRASRIAWWAVWLPVWIAIATTVFWIGWGLWQAGAASLDPIYTALPDNRYAFAGYMPLIIAIPFVLEYVAEWSSHQYVLVVDQESLAARLLIHAGVLRYDLETVALERTVTTRVHQSFADSMIAVGDVELTETAGGEGQRFASVWRPRRLAHQIQRAISARRRKSPAETD